MNELAAASVGAWLIAFADLRGYGHRWSRSIGDERGRAVSDGSTRSSASAAIAAIAVIGGVLAATVAFGATATGSAVNNVLPPCPTPSPRLSSLRAVTPTPTP